jgi:glycolate oxidase FAD binding subunit
VAAFNRWAGAPLPLSGAAWWQGCAFVRLSGAAPAVRAARQQLGGELLAEGESQDFWEALRHCRLPSFAADVLWRVSLPAATPPLPLPGEPLIDWGGALRWYADPPAAVDLRALAQAAGGSAQCWRGAAPGARFHPLAATVAQLHRRLKERFDPHGIFNPGRLLAGM